MKWLSSKENNTDNCVQILNEAFAFHIALILLERV